VFKDFLYSSLTRQAMYVERSIEARSQNNFCRRKAISIAYFCVRVCGCESMGAGVYLRPCNLNYPACNAHAPYCLWPLEIHHICWHYLINGTIFGKKILNIKCVFWFSLHTLSKTFPILRQTQRDIVINTKTSTCQVAVIDVRFKCNLDFFDRF
jgi:hypothetical protein